MSQNHLIIGLGGTGGKIIRSLRKMIYQEFRAVNPDVVNLEYLYVDSSREMMEADDPTWRSLGRSVQLGTNAQLLIQGANLKDILANVQNYPGIKEWIGSREEWATILNSIVGETLGGQKRRLGRFLFACKAAQFKEQLQNQVRALQTKGDIPVTFHVICGLAGGTGSGCIIDVISQIRATYPDARVYRIVVYALLPDRNPKSNWDTGNYHANGYAALMELNALSVGAWQPHDVTGAHGTERLALQDPFNGCYVFTNENEKGLFVDVGAEIPNIVANFLYQKVIAVRDQAWDTLRRQENAENGDGSPETSPGAGTGERSKRFLTFGIKRLAIPEEEIREYLTFNFARQAALQLQYNNWSDAQSFAEEAKNASYKEMVRQPETMTRWMLSDDHLRLSVGILPDEINNPRWKPINATWADIVPHFKTFVRDNYKNDRRVWLDELSKLCEKRYAAEYRELGVAKFYQTKEGDRKDHLREIRARVEGDLIESWRNGVLSMADIRRQLDALVAFLEERLASMDDKVIQAVKNEENAAGRVVANQREWANLGIIADAMGKRDRVFEAQGVVLQEQYIFRTLAQSWRFAKGLLQALIGEFTSLQNEAGAAAGMIATSTEQFNRNIAERCNDEGKNDLKAQLVKFYDPQFVKDFTKTLVRNKDEQLKQTKAVRDNLLSELGERPTFADFNRVVTREHFIDVLEAECEEKAQQAHDLLVSEGRDKRRLLGDSIVDRLHQEYGGNIEAMEKYVRELVNMAGNYVNFVDSEISKRGEGIPEGVPSRVSSFTAIMPPSPAHVDFSSALREAFVKSTKVPMEFIPSKEIPCEVKPNEIALISVTNLFPLRYLDQTEFLRAKYATRINGNEPARAKLELHCEGDGTQCPPLFVPSAASTKEQGLPYVLLGSVLGVIQKVTNPTTGIAQLALVTKDENGFDNEPVMLGANILEASDRLDSANARVVRVEVEKLLRTDYAHIDKKAEVQKAILALVQEIKGLTGDNVQDVTYRSFVDAAKKAVTTLKGGQ